MPKFRTKAFGLVRKIPVGSACMVFSLSALFMVMPSSGYDNLWEEEWFWGWPRYAYWVGHSTEGDWSGLAWDYLIFDLLFWISYFSLLGVLVTVILRKITRVKIHPFYSLCVIGTLTSILFIHLYRPDIFINSMTGGYFDFLESRPEQLDLAIRFGDVETVQSLLENDPDLVFSKSRSITGSTPLHEAAFRGQSSITRLLLADGASVNKKGGIGDTPLFASAFMGYTGTVELLLKNGATVDIKSMNGETPLYGAAKYGHYRIAELLLASKADVNAKSNDSSTPFLEAAAGGYEKMMQLLIASNAEINVTNDMGQTPLYMAAGNGHKDAVELLLANKAEINATDKYGDTPLQNALGNFHKDVVELLEQHGATNSY